MATKAPTVDFVQVVASEMAFGIDRAVECWLAPIERALSNRQLTMHDRLNAVQEVVRKYKQLTGKGQLKSAANPSGSIIERPGETS
jgi:hypothetical protein